METPASESITEQPVESAPEVAETDPMRTNSAPGSGSLLPKSGDQQLVDMKFDYQIQDRAPLLRFVLVATSNFNLVKKDAKTYQLVLPQCGLKDGSLALPQFPPHDFVGFNMVQPEFDGNNTTITIGVDRGLRISAFARGNEIWVKALNK